MLAPSEVRRFEEEGFVLLRGLLDPRAEMAALDAAYQDLIETLVWIHFAEANARPPPSLRDRPLGEGFALMQGASGGRAVEHLDPLLSAFHKGHVRRGDLPSAQIPELFGLLRAPPLLDALESLLGPEIDASPSYHLNFKLPEAHVAVSRETAAKLRLPDPAARPFHGFHLGQTGWHRDGPHSLADSHSSRIVVAWIPMTPAGGARGSLVVLPGSHRDRHAPPPPDAQLREACVEVAASPGDVLLFDNWLLHASTPNVSEEDIRWAFSFRYLPHGQAAGRPYLPTVLLRSRAEPAREFRNPMLWSVLWRRALDHLARPSSPTPQTASVERARDITEEWRRRVPDESGWLRLAPDPVWGPRATVRHVHSALRRIFG